MLFKSSFTLVCIFLFVCTSIAQLNPALTYGTVKDIDGNTYNTIKIGTQTWMAENLRTTKYRNGSKIPLVSDSTRWATNLNNETTLPMMCWYNNDQATYTANKFGALYNWYAVNPSTNGNNNVCPTGWHVPTEGEWSTLIKFLGVDAGGRMKNKGTQYWASPNAGATNSSGFSGLPGGFRGSDGAFAGTRKNGYFWSSTGDEDIVDVAWSFPLVSKSAFVNWYLLTKSSGFSVRCLRD
jgi:uncharacterized protein (TIGR02145 family)